MFLPGLGRDVRPDGEGRWVQQAGGCSGGVRISGRPRSRVIEAGRVVSVGVIGGEPAELVAGEFRSLLVVRGGVFRGGGG